MAVDQLPQADPVARPAPVKYYEDASCTIWHGDARDVLPTLEQVDCVITDPPYAISEQGLWHIGRPGKGRRRFDFFDGDTEWADMTALVVDVARLTLPLLSASGSQYWWCGHREFGPLVSLFEAAQFKTRFMVWSKAAPSPPPPGAGWPSGAELCVYAFRPGRTWNHDGRNPPSSNVLVADSYRHGQPGKQSHPTQKPESVIKPLLAASTRPGDTILDPFMGSGTTLVSAKRLGRKAIGVDLSEQYCQVAAARLSQGALDLFGGNDALP